MIMRGFLMLFAILCSQPIFSSKTDDPKNGFLNAGFRGPAALVLADAGRLLLVANRRSGTIVVADPRSQKVLAEAAIGKQLSSLVAVSCDKWLIATDEGAHELILIRRGGSDLIVAARLAVPQHPVSVQVAPDGKSAFVASLWSRKLAIVTIEPGSDEKKAARLEISRIIALPFAPRKQLLVEDGKRLIIADAFGGKLAVVDPSRGEIEMVRELPAHNIRGLGLNPTGDRLLVAHQVLNALARTTTDDVHWGMLMGNVVRSLELRTFLDKDADVLKGSVAHPLGEAGRAAADPGAIAVVGLDRRPGAVNATRGELAVALAGVGELCLFSEESLEFRRVPLGGRPGELVVGHDGRHVYVADELEDSISIVDVKEGKRVRHISLPQPDLNVAQRGERLFYDGRLSHDGWMSCHSCHTDGHSNGLVNDNLGDGTFGAPKRVLSLLGVGRTAPWAWNGEIQQFEEQIKKSVTTTMRGKPPNDDEVQALAAFLRTLEPPPAVQRDGSVGRAQRGPPDPELERGRSIFRTRKCDRCHAPPEYTSAGVYDVGLKDEAGNKSFNPPSLRGVGQRDRLFHDNRAASLEEVFTKFHHQIGDTVVPESEVAALVEFLRSL